MICQITQINQLKTKFLGCLFQTYRILSCAEIIINGICKRNTGLRRQYGSYRLKREIDGILYRRNDLQTFHIIVSRN